MRAVVTGATVGLGAALAAALTAAGAEVSGCGSRADPAPNARVDVTDPAAVTAWAAEVGAPVHLVVANAAVSLPNRAAAAVSAEEFRRVLDVNVVGVLTTFTAFLPHAAVDCVFVALSSRWGMSAPRGGQLPYCASKFAVEGLVAAWRWELGPAQRAYAVDPGGGLDTAMNTVMAGPGAPSGKPLAGWAARAARFVTGLGERPPGPVHLVIPEE